MLSAECEVQSARCEVRATANPQLSATVLSTPVFGDVTSANIVGYATTTTESGSDFTPITPFFVSVDSENKIKLSDFSFTFERNDTIQMFDGAGNGIKTLKYKRRGSAPNYEYYWELSDYTEDLDNPVVTEVDDFDFARGMSIWLCTKYAVDFTQAGAVNSKPTVYTIPGGSDFVQAGNCRPTDLKLSEIEFSSIDRNDTIQIFNGAGDCVKSLKYKRRGSAPNYEYYWELSDYTNDPDSPEVTEIDPDKYIFKPGDHFWFCMKNEGTATIPGVQL